MVMSHLGVGINKGLRGLQDAVYEGRGLGERKGEAGTAASSGEGGGKNSSRCSVVQAGDAYEAQSGHLRVGINKALRGLA
jgi:hypothetical protein